MSWHVVIVIVIADFASNLCPIPQVDSRSLLSLHTKSDSDDTEDWRDSEETEKTAETKERIHVELHRPEPDPGRFAAHLARLL